MTQGGFMLRNCVCRSRGLFPRPTRTLTLQYQITIFIIYQNTLIALTLALTLSLHHMQCMFVRVWDPTSAQAGGYRSLPRYIAPLLCKVPVRVGPGMPRFDLVHRHPTRPTTCLIRRCHRTARARPFHTGIFAVTSFMDS